MSLQVHFILYYFWRYKIKYFISPYKNIPLPEGKRAFIFLAADYGNLGDVAITYAQHHFLELIYPDYSIVEVPSSYENGKLKSYLSKVRATDIVTIVGGGNMGDLWKPFEMLRQLVISESKKTQVLCFPQTALFSNTLIGEDYLRSAKKVYSRNNVILMAREKTTYSFMKNNFLAKVFLVPDIVLTLKKWNLNLIRKGISLCLRKDIEKAISEEDFQLLNNYLISTNNIVFKLDTHVGNNLVNNDNKYEILDSFIKKVASTEILVTDRLHGMIFAYITATPAIVLPNSNHKIKECYEWIKDCGFIYLMSKFDYKDFKSKFNEMIGIRIDFDILEQNNIRFSNYFKQIIDETQS